MQNSDGNLQHIMFGNSLFLDYRRNEFRRVQFAGKKFGRCFYTYSVNGVSILHSICKCNEITQKTTAWNKIYIQSMCVSARGHARVYTAAINLFMCVNVSENSTTAFSKYRCSTCINTFATRHKLKYFTITINFLQLQDNIKLL